MFNTNKKTKYTRPQMLNNIKIYKSEKYSVIFHGEISKAVSRGDTYNSVELWLSVHF